MDTKNMIIAALAATTAASTATALVLYNKKNTAEGEIEVLKNQIEDFKERELVYQESQTAMEDDRHRLLEVIRSYKEEKENAVESMKSVYEAAKTDNVFDYYEKNIKGTELEDRIETKYDIDKKECEEAIEEEQQEFINEYRQRLREISEETGVDVHLAQDEEQPEERISYGGHNLAAEEDSSKWAMPSLEEVDDTPAWYVEPHQPDKNGRVAPYEINNLTFTQDKDYTKRALFYYPMMERLEDEEGAKEDIDTSISWMALTWFGSDPEDPNRIYVRNQERKVDYEVIQID